MQTALAEATRTIVSACDGTAVPPQNFHFTLAFLGAVPESRIPDLAPIATRVALAFKSVAAAGGAGDALSGSGPPITIVLDRVELWRKSKVLCATPAAEPTAAIALAETLKRVLAGQGSAPHLDTSELAGNLTIMKFRPHVTLARKTRTPVRSIQIEPLLWSFREFALVESQPGPSGSAYRRLQTYPLG